MSCDHAFLITVLGSEERENFFFSKLSKPIMFFSSVNLRHCKECILTKAHSFSTPKEI